MAKSLLEQLPDIVAQGRKTAEKILESIESRHRISLQTREVVLPAKDSAAQDWITQQARTAQREVFAPGQSSLLEVAQPMLGAASDTPDASPWTNRLIYGDNLLAMAALLAGDEGTPSLRGKVDLIYIDPPFDSKADYRTKVTLPGVELEQKPTVIEQFAYSDTWSDGTASYLAMITPRLILMRELLADTGSIYVHLDWHVGHYVKIVMDEVFGKRYFENEIIWHYSQGGKSTEGFAKKHDLMFVYTKSANRFFDGKAVRMPFTPHKQDKSGKNYGGRMGIDEDGREYVEKWGTGMKKLYRYYLDEGKVPENVWSDIQSIQSDAGERSGYATQKPEPLLERVILASCPLVSRHEEVVG